MRMRHFSSEQWADFVRRALKRKDMQEMQAHIESGCDQCKDAVAAWMRVTSLAARESAFEPPAAIVKMAKAAMKLHARPLRSSIAKLLFDSVNAPLLAGVRSSSSQPRQLLYGFDEYRVDLRFEPNFDADRALLLGQILSSSADDQGAGSVAVALLRGGQILGTATTNEFGEFQLECDLGGRLELQLTLPEGEIVNVPMVEPAGDEKSKVPKLLAAKDLQQHEGKRKKSTRKQV
ncbi:MAG: hypothetical protein ACRD4X_01050 [Candidatus Acidiferrales bacterium]